MASDDGAPPPSNDDEALRTHYSWNDRTAARAAELLAMGVDMSPKALPPPAAASAAAVSAVAAPAAAPGGSSWNAAGTWEERDVTASATADLKARLLAAAPAPSGGKRVVFTAVSVCTGTVSRVWSRGKAKVAFELAVTASWEVHDSGGGGSGGGALAEGTCSVAEASDMDADVFECLDVRVARTNGCAGAEATALVKVSDDDLRATFRAWVDAIKASAR